MSPRTRVLVGVVLLGSGHPGAVRGDPPGPAPCPPAGIPCPPPARIVVEVPPPIVTFKPAPQTCVRAPAPGCGPGVQCYAFTIQPPGPTPVYAPPPMYAPAPVYAQSPMYAPAPVYSPPPVYAPPPAYAPAPVYAPVAHASGPGPGYAPPPGGCGAGHAPGPGYAPGVGMSGSAPAPSSTHIEAALAAQRAFEQTDMRLRLAALQREHSDLSARYAAAYGVGSLPGTPGAAAPGAGATDTIGAKLDALQKGLTGVVDLLEVHNAALRKAKLIP